MMPLLTIGSMLLIFYAGILWNLHGVIGLMFLGFGLAAVGTLFAAIETREMQARILASPIVTFQRLRLEASRLEAESGQFLSETPLYVQTGEGIRPVTGIVIARINGRRSFMLDLQEPTPDHAEQFNALKQGVM